MYHLMCPIKRTSLSFVKIIVRDELHDIVYLTVKYPTIFSTDAEDTQLLFRERVEMLALYPPMR